MAKQMKGISCCGDCSYYSQLEMCLRGSKDAGSAQDPFYKDCPLPDVVELNRDKLIKLLSRYFTIGNSYTYELIRVKEAFEVGTMTFDDFVEWDEHNVAILADWLIKALKEADNG